MKTTLNVPVNSTYHEVKSEFAIQWEKNKDEKYKEYRRKWSENAKNFIVEKAPLHLDIEPTNACNLKCPMCPRTVILNDESKNENFHVGNMKLETFKKLIDEAVEIGVYSIKLNWLGEPLVHKDIVEMVRYAKEKGIIDVMFNTNAALLTEDISRKLIEAGLDKIFFSFDSPYKEQYEEIRVGASYEESLENIKSIVKIRNSMGKTTPLTRVSMVLMDDNKEAYNDFVELFKDIVDIVAYVEYREPIGEGMEITENVNGFACAQLWERMFVAWDGEVIVCCVDSERGYVAGNIHENSIKEIWNGEKYAHIRKCHKDGEFYKIGICSKCDLPLRKKDGDV